MPGSTAQDPVKIHILNTLEHLVRSIEGTKDLKKIASAPGKYKCTVSFRYILSDLNRDAELYLTYVYKNNTGSKDALLFFEYPQEESSLMPKNTLPINILDYITNRLQVEKIQNSPSAPYNYPDGIVVEKGFRWEIELSDLEKRVRNYTPKP